MFFQWILTRLKNRKDGQKDMDKKLVSKLDVMLSSGIIYPYVSEKKLTQLTKPSATKILSMNSSLLFF